MSKLDVLKLFLFGTLLVAVVSTLVMFHYSVSFSTFRVHLAAKLDIASSRDLYERELLSNATLPANLTGENVTDKTIRPLDVHNQNVEDKDVVAISLDLSTSDSHTSDGGSQDKSPQKNGENSTTTKTITVAANTENQDLCPETGPTLVGPLAVDQSVPKMEELEKEFSSEFGGWVNKGGAWKPTECKARKKMALIIPYRNRNEQLSIFVRHMHPMLKRQNLDYRIVVVEQFGNTAFNRGMLFNVGFKEALKFDQYECLIFHDVDLIPEDDRNEYGCPSSPRHLSVAIDKFGYRLPYSNIFGGAGSFSREHFELINGFSNKFWGWGGEDDDLFNRIHAKGLKLTRPSMQLGRYKMVRLHHNSAKPDQNRFEKLKDSGERMSYDGIGSVKYNVKQVTEHRLYTLVTVDIDPSMTNYR